MHTSAEYRAAVATYYGTAHRPYQELSLGMVSGIFNDGKERETLPAEQALHTSQRLLILGDPGVGKTTLLDRHAYELAKNNLGTPIFAPLRRYVTNLRELLQAQVSRFLDISLEDLVAANPKGMSILLDGLDEVAPPLSNRVLADINDLSHAWSTAQVVVTARTGYYLGGFENDWKVLELLPLSDAEVHAALAAIAPPTVVNEVFADQRLLEMARRPLFLHTIATSVGQNADVRQYVLDAATQYFVWRGHSKSLLPIDVSVEVIGRGLELLAMEFVRKRSTWLERTEVIAILSMDASLGDIAGSIESVLATDVMDHDGERVRFSHVAYLEAYAAKYLRSSLREGGVSSLDLRATLDAPMAKGILSDLFRLLTLAERQRFLARCTAATLADLMRLVPNELAQHLHESNSRPMITAHAVVEALEVADRAEIRGKSRRDVLVFAIHGFNTRGQWKNALSVLLNLETDGARFIYAPWDYGVFRLSILNPFARRRKVNDFQMFYNQVLDTYGAERPDVCAVAHSFGTYIVGNSMRLFEEVRFDRVILLRSVLPRSFPWGKLQNKCAAVLSERGGADGALWFAQFAPGLGASGRYGFNMPGQTVREHINEFGEHSTMFGPRYMRESWIPFLRDGVRT